MYEILNELLKDKKIEPIFSCFGIWHLLYIFIVIALIIFLVFIFKKKQKDSQLKLINCTINIAFSLYMLDFFLMPFAYKEIDLEKLPFHICTITCVLSFIARHNNKLNKYAIPISILVLVGNFIYLIYPAGVGWYQINIFSYRVVQTLLYHLYLQS